jgi:hypothetical protein
MIFVLITNFFMVGLFSRLMIRMMHFANSIVTYWTNGAILSKSEDSILLRIIPDERCITISVRGPSPIGTARVVMETITNLIHNWYDLEVKEKIPCSHCLLAGQTPYMFAAEECAWAAATGVSEVKCKGIHPVPIDEIVPGNSFIIFKFHYFTRYCYD